MKNLVTKLAICSLALVFAALLFKVNYLKTPVACASANQQRSLKPGKTLKAFQSKAELDAFLREFAKQSLGRSKTEEMQDGATNMAAPMASSEASKSDKDESVTNTQHAGVDEGGIVKLHGEHLIILRRGRLFTVGIGDKSLRPVSAIDAFPPDADPGGTWYDEMLVSANTIAVIGYSYSRGGTEIGLFNIDETGKLAYRSTYHLRSNDYYSSRNYASRLIDGKLIFYTPQYLWINPNDPTAQFPALRKWHKDANRR